MVNEYAYFDDLEPEYIFAHANDPIYRKIYISSMGDPNYKMPDETHYIHVFWAVYWQMSHLLFPLITFSTEVSHWEDNLL